eukprot:scaffold55490_cov61-Cyclotella_meneghiniana.AAC.9
MSPFTYVPTLDPKFLRTSTAPCENLQNSKTMCKGDVPQTESTPWSAAMVGRLTNYVGRCSFGTLAG